MSSGLIAKAFGVMLIDTIYYDEIKQYLKSRKSFQRGRGIYYELESGLKVIYFLIEYSKPTFLDITKMPYCRVKKAYASSIKKFENLMEETEEVWNEYAINESKPKKQNSIDKYFQITKEASIGPPYK